MGKKHNKIYILNTIISVSLINKSMSSLATDLYPSGPNRIPPQPRGQDLFPLKRGKDAICFFPVQVCCPWETSSQRPPNATQLLFLSLFFFTLLLFLHTSEKVSTFVSVQNSRGPLSHHSLCFLVLQCLYKHHISRLCTLLSWRGKTWERKIVSTNEHGFSYNSERKHDCYAGGETEGRRKRKET